MPFVRAGAVVKSVLMVAPPRPAVTPEVLSRAPAPVRIRAPPPALIVVEPLYTAGAVNTRKPGPDLVSAWLPKLSPRPPAKVTKTGLVTVMVRPPVKLAAP